MRAKNGLLAAWLLVCLLVLSGCVEQLSERELLDLAQHDITVQTEAPTQDASAEQTFPAALYFLSGDGRMLVPTVRSVTAQGGVSRAQAVVSALLEGPQEGERGVMWPDLGTARSGRFVEVSGGIATVDLPARARTLPQETLYAVRMAIAGTLTELPEISYVNVLIGGREEGLDLGATLPVGTFARVQDLDAAARFARLQEQRLSDSGVTLLTTLYFPAQDGRLILPEVRSIAYSQVSPIEYLYTLLGELGKGGTGELTMKELPAPLDYIEEMPEIVRTEDGYLAIELRFNTELEKAIEQQHLTLGVYMAMLTDTLMGFVPGVEGLKVSIGEREVTSLDAQETPHGREQPFGHTLATRSDFAGYIGAPVTLYAMEESGGLQRLVRSVEQDAATHARARLLALMRLEEEGRFALPHGMDDADVLAVDMNGEAIVLNLSAAFARALAALDQAQERAAVYAMVNTLTEGTDVSRVIFFFEGEQIETLAGAVDMRGAFVRNPGMVVN